MNAFEQIVARFFEAQGYWTRVGLKIAVTKEEKRAVGNPSMPRPEVDVVAFKPGPNELLIVECKSYLDSNGVRIESFIGEDSVHKDRLKLFNLENLRKLITEKLVAQLREEGLLLQNNPTIRYGLVAGKIKAGDEAQLREIFNNNGWLLITPGELALGLREFADRGYEDDIVTMVVKILERNTVS
jgi:hypothetical protein